MIPLVTPANTESDGAASATSLAAPRRDFVSSPWLRFAARRAGGVVLSLALLTIVTFSVVQLLPGDPAVTIAGPDATVGQIDSVRQELGLDRSLPEQFVDYVARVVHGDFGQSFVTGEPVADVIFVRLPYTAEIALLAIVLTLVLAVAIGMVVGIATRGGRMRALDVSFGMFAGVVSSIPPYVTASALVAIFAVGLRLLPAGGAENLSSLILPTIALAFAPIFGIARVVRRETAGVLEQDYVRTARGWRVPRFRLYRRYVLSNLVTATLTLSGIVLTGMLGGAVVMETVLAWPGLGKGLVDAIVRRDFPVIQGIIFVLGLLGVLLQLMVDVVLGLLDPRTLGEGSVHA